MERDADQGLAATATAPATAPPRPAPPRRATERRPSGAFSFELATAADDADVRRLLRESPMGGAVSVTLEREPDASVAAAVEGDVHHTVVARDRSTGAVAAVGAVSVRDAYLNGHVARLGYLGQLRLARAYTGRASVLRGGYAFLRRLHETTGASVYLTSIFSDNHRARRFLERGLPGMPAYRPLETFETLLMPVAWRPNPPAGGRVRKNVNREPEDLVDCLRRNGPRYQLSPAWTQSSLDLLDRTGTLGPADFHYATPRGHDVKGCLAVWDQRPFKQVVVRGYCRPLAAARPLINLASGLVGGGRLPAAGEALDMAYLSHVAVDGDDPEVFEALLRSAHADARSRGLQYLALGLASRHPLLPVAGRLFRHRRTVSTLYAVHWEDGADAVARLDGRVAHCEVALL